MNTSSDIAKMLIEAVVSLLVYVLLSWAKKRVDVIFEGLSVNQDSLFGTINVFLDNTASATKTLAAEAKTFMKEDAGNGIRAFINSAVDLLKMISQLLVEHIKSILDTIFGAPPEYKSWRISGAVIELLLLGLFVYADISQGYNNLTGTKVFQDIQVPTFFQSLAIPILVASVGSIASLAFVLFDLYGMTHFAPWDWLWGAIEERSSKENADNARRTVIRIVIGTMIASPIFTLMISMGRITSFINVTPEWQNFINLMVGLAQWLIMAPMLITTIFLIWGAASIFLGYVAIVGTLSLIPWIIALILKLLDVIIFIVGFILIMLLMILAFAVEKSFVIFSALVKLLRLVLNLTHGIIDLLAYPMRRLLKVDTEN